MDQAIGIRLPESFLSKISELSKEELVDRSTFMRKLIKKGYENYLKEKSLEKYKKGQITLSKAAEIANLTLFDMERYLIENGVKSDYDLDDFAREKDLLKQV